MGISLNVSNALQPLSVRLSEDLKSQTGDPFAPQWVVTQTEGMNSWLRIELANRLGIAANIRFCKPNDIISRIHQWCDPAGKADLDEETTRWNLYTILGSDTFEGLFPEIKAYYGDTTSSASHSLMSWRIFTTNTRYTGLNTSENGTVRCCKGRLLPTGRAGFGSNSRAKPVVAIMIVWRCPTISSRPCRIRRCSHWSASG